MFAADTVCDNSIPNPDKRAPGLLQSFSCSANAHVFSLYMVRYPYNLVPRGCDPFGQHQVYVRFPFAR